MPAWRIVYISASCCTVLITTVLSICLCKDYCTQSTSTPKRQSNPQPNLVNEVELIKEAETV